MRELVVLGTASQVPTRTRNQNGYLLRWDGQGMLFDPGEGTQRRMLHAGVASTADHPDLPHPRSRGPLLRASRRAVADGPRRRARPGGAALPGLWRGHSAGAGGGVGSAARRVLLPVPTAGAGEVAPGLWVRAAAAPDRDLRLPPGRAGRADDGDGSAEGGGHQGGRHRAAPAHRAPADRGPRGGRERAAPRAALRPRDGHGGVRRGGLALAEGADLLVAESTFSDDDAGLAGAVPPPHRRAGRRPAPPPEARARSSSPTSRHATATYSLLAEQARARAGGAAVVAANDLDRIALPKRRQIAIAGRRSSP